MCSMEKLKNLAIKQIRAATHLYEMAEAIEQGFDRNNEEYNEYLIKANRQFREEKLKFEFNMVMTTEENELWNEISI